MVSVRYMVDDVDAAVAFYTELLGAERVEERVFPYGDLVRSGAVVTFGADLPGVDVDEIPPLIHVQAAVTRTRPGHPDDRPFVPRQAIDLYAALKCQTINGAYQLRMEDRKGSEQFYVHAQRNLDAVVEKSLRGAALWDEVKQDLRKKGALALSGVCDDFMAEPFHRFHPPERERVREVLEAVMTVVA